MWTAIAKRFNNISHSSASLTFSSRSLKFWDLLLLLCFVCVDSILSQWFRGASFVLARSHFPSAEGDCCSSLISFICACLDLVYGCKRLPSFVWNDCFTFVLEWTVFYINRDLKLLILVIRLPVVVCHEFRGCIYLKLALLNTNISLFPFKTFFREFTFFQTRIHQVKQQTFHSLTLFGWKINWLARKFTFENSLITIHSTATSGKKQTSRRFYFIFCQETKSQSKMS